MEEKQLEKRISILKDKYNMSTEPEIGADEDKFSLGKVHIFNNQKFDDSRMFPYRVGSEKDVKNLKETFEKLNFSTPQVHENLDGIPFQQKIKDIAKDVDKELENCRSLVCVFLSHGKDEHIFMKDRQVEVDLIFEELSNIEKLRNKPKIFIFQACRGSKNNDPDTAGPTPEAFKRSQSKTFEEEDAIPEELYDCDGLSGRTPKGADCLTAYSTTKGYVSFRNTEKGSWFIQNLCEVLQDYAAGKYNKYRPDILELLTLVSAEVSGKSVYRRGRYQKQMPSFVSTLRKRLFLRDYDHEAV